ncbi:ribonuclease E/G [Novosphingobium sp. 1949]|uniref:Ribonuclease E/G n=1 Tax=Novosphingobium organovorum TaxID=2930092 RepID=A0ABT0B9V2_9SPHN|nr:ribonuclease E/G [Novosphingobium organovorum]MCJ2181650.1 ribonuclease E/G [Novosphingobium organovorum]
MAEWLIEEGIGETRAILFDRGEAIAARLFLAGETRAGQVEDALLIARQSGSRRGTVRLASGEEALVDALPREASQGAPLRVVVTRAAITESQRTKRAQVRPTSAPPGAAPDPATLLGAEGVSARRVQRFPEDPWPELIAQAIEGTIAFDGGALIVSPTPAMTLIDIDGTLPPAQLARAAVPAIAQAIGLFALGGSIGIDFPTLERKEDRRSVDAALAEALDHWPHQSTAMNGFGFVQLVARSEGPSLLHRVRADPARCGARLLLRYAEAVREPGVLLLTCAPAVRRAVTPQWEAELIRRTGRTIRWKEDPALALGAGFAQALSA